MKKILILFLFLIPIIITAQTTQEGKVSFTSSKNIYVKFESTKNLNIGDSLYIQQNGDIIPVLVITNKSSTSVIGTALNGHIFKKGDELIAKIREKKETPQEEKPSNIDIANTNLPEEENSNIKYEKDEKEISTPQKIKGRISLASYNNISEFRNRTRMRYTFTFRGDHLNNSKFSVGSFINFHHTMNEPITDIAEALKVYSLYGKYDFNKTTSLVLGRKINPKFSSVGAIDGLQFEKSINRIQLGAIAGFRPNILNYAPDFNLFQYGAYIGLGPQKGKRLFQTTLGFMEQRNKGLVDRRYLFIQHQSELAPNLNLFSSMEVDLFENVSDTINTRASRLASLYVSLNYRVSRNFRISASYDNRRNIIFYETYKNFIDQLLEDETRQGIRLGFVYRPIKNLTWSVTSGLRFQTNNTNNSRNVNTNLSYRNVPFIKANTSVNFTYLETDFLRSLVYGARLSKQLFKNRVRGELSYRFVDYTYATTESGTQQHIGGLDLSFTIAKSFNFHLFYEGIFDKNIPQTNHRFNIKLIYRF